MAGWVNDDTGCAIRRRTRISSSLVHRDTVLSTKEPDNAVIINGMPCLITRLEKNNGVPQVYYKPFMIKENYFSTQDNFFIDSTAVGIVLAHRMCDAEFKVAIDDILCKCVCIPVNMKYLFIPILHTCVKSY
jgi:hypothetical protein